MSVLGDSSQQTSRADMHCHSSASQLSPGFSHCDLHRRACRAHEATLRGAAVRRGDRRGAAPGSRRGHVAPAPVPARPVARAYASADIFLFPSSTDTFGQVILEAQASGLPVVAVSGGGPLSLVEA